MKLTRVTKVETRKYTGKVYDLSVKDIPSYSVEDLIVHNSGAGSIICYALDITTLDPIRFGLLFERFLNPSRMEVPLHQVDEISIDSFRAIMPTIDIDLIE
jgi:hypothetical protein